ncbi:hypothetical protein, partial [Synechococcus sp. UW179B]|uniref:hypothetical protein n=1 Tax=Synechococcus sp. UW179B TaxID=2575516 RepID=UPI001A7E1A06
ETKPTRLEVACLLLLPEWSGAIHYLTALGDMGKSGTVCACQWARSAGTKHHLIGLDFLFLSSVGFFWHAAALRN